MSKPCLGIVAHERPTSLSSYFNVGYTSRNYSILYGKRVSKSVTTYMMFSQIHKTHLFDSEQHSLSDLSGISTRCDWFVHHEQCIRTRNTPHPKTIFMKAQSEARTISYFLKQVLPHLFKPFVLVIGHHDYTFPDGTGDLRHNPCQNLRTEIQILLDSPLILRMFVENLDNDSHPKLKPIPLGLLPYSPTCQLAVERAESPRNDASGLLDARNRIRDHIPVTGRAMIIVLILTTIGHNRHTIPTLSLKLCCGSPPGNYLSVARKF
jgi:hypothetical protein